MTLQAPTPENYKQWYADRIERTNAVMAKQKAISGRQVREQNLSMKVLYDSGYQLNTATDTMERTDG